MKAALLRALAAHDARCDYSFTAGGRCERTATYDGRCDLHWFEPNEDCPAPDIDPRPAPMCGADCGGSPCSREAGHRDRCDPEGTDPSPLRIAVRRALDAPTGPTQAALARAGGIAPENLSAWLAGRRTIPVRAIEAMLAQLDLVIVPRA